ncbi:MAG: DUF6390 family protein [Chloroflexi bacterium]|nr:DUF6390 family protein [Chloroflexota bacterium]
MPNRLQYCGGDENRTLLQYAVEGESDDGLTPMLRRFTGAMPYLELIARSNGLADPFDPRVVEAYWIGNSLLDRVEVRQLYDDMLERFGSRLTGRMREIVLGKAPAGARPHHSFHVLDVHSRVGELAHSMETLDGCRVSWGRVTQVESSELVVDRRPLALEGGQLVLGEPRSERVLRQLDGRGFADGAAVGDLVTLHWGWVCEVLSENDIARLERWTRHHLGIANLTL